MNAGIVFLIRSPNVDERALSRLRSELRMLTGKGRQIVLDFSAVETVNASCAGLVLEMAERLRRIGGSLKLVGVRKDVAAFFELLRIHRSVEMHLIRSGSAGLQVAA